MHLSPLIGILKAFTRLDASFNHKVTLFSAKDSEYCYHPAQLFRKHRVMGKSADFACAFMNVWRQSLKELVLDPTLKDRMARCLFSYSSLAKAVTTCDSKLCPMCRAVQVLHVRKLMDNLGPVEPVTDGYWIGGTPYDLKRDRKAVLSVRNVLYRDNKFFYKVIGLRPIPRSVETTENKDTWNLVFRLMAYDFSILGDTKVLEEWVLHTRGIRSFSRRSASCL